MVPKLLIVRVAAVTFVEIPEVSNLIKYLVMEYVAPPLLADFKNLIAFVICVLVFTVPVEAPLAFE